LKKLRQLSLIGCTDFFTLCHIISVEFRPYEKTETFAVAKASEGDLMVTAKQFDPDDHDIRSFLSNNTFRD
jgi:hypothetical protein